MIVIHALSRGIAYLLAALLVLLLATACGDNTGVSLPTPPPAVPVASIVIEPLAPSLIVGQTMQLAAVTRAANGDALPDRPVAWRSEADAIARVSATGVVTAVAAGNATLVATSGTVSQRIGVTISAAPSADPAAFIIFDTPGVTLVEHGEQRVRATVRDAQANELPGRVITWETDNADVATITADGRVQGLNEGTARLTANHGTLKRVLNVRVNPSFGGEIVYDVTRPSIGRPMLYRMDMSTEFGSVTEIFPHPGSWEASVSPDGSRIAFTCEADGPAICVSHIYGYGLQVLTGGDRANEDQPSWSPDGESIAFRRWPHGATPGPFNPTDIWVMDATGAQQTNITADAASQHHPAWSPRPVEGAYRIAFTQDSLVDGYRTARIALMRADGSDRQWLTEFTGGVDENPSWRPDGGALLFTRAVGTVTYDVYQYDFTTGHARSLVSLPGVQNTPVYSPNGRYIAFTSQHEAGDDQSIVSQIYTVRADGTRRVRRTATMPAKEHLAWRRVP